MYRRQRGAAAADVTPTAARLSVKTVEDVYIRRRYFPATPLGVKSYVCRQDAETQRETLPGELQSLSLAGTNSHQTKPIAL